MSARAARPWTAACWLLLACTSIGSAHAEIGTVVFASGHSSLTTPEGKTARVRKGQEVGSGHVVRTGAAGHVQIRFRDGTQVSVHPSSDLRVDAYRYHSDPEQGEAALFTLYRGSVRFMTGAIGKLEGSQFRVATAAAALELHGSEVVAVVAGDLRVTVGAGRVVVRNDGGALTATSGQRVLVRDRRTAPVVIGSLLPYPVVPEAR